MSDHYLYSELFSADPHKVEKKEANDDVLNSLFAIQMPTSVAGNELKRKKTEEE